MSSDTSKDVQFHGTVTVWSKGQVVIPKPIREMLEIESWDSLVAITKWWRAVWFIKADNLEEMMDYISSEMESCK
jgi:AbrB family looped-hinge helix DNA binding protein